VRELETAVSDVHVWLRALLQPRGALVETQLRARTYTREAGDDGDGDEDDDDGDDDYDEGDDDDDDDDD
jgi:hypothetical protein